MFTVTGRELALAGRPARTVAEVTGEIDATCAEQFVTAIEEFAGARPVIADLSGLTYVDSAGLAVLDQLLGRNRILLVLQENSPVRAAVKLVGLDFLESVEEALRTLSR